MEQIDVQDFEKELKKTRIKRMLKNKRVIYSVAISIAQLSSIILNDISFFKVFGGVVIGFEFSLLKRYWKREKIEEETQTTSMLRTTTTYNEILNEYKNYIKDIATLIKSTDLNSSKESVVYLHALMELGYFSKLMNHQYKTYNYEEEYLEELLGAKVTTGTSVCRHMSSFMADVMNELGYTAANITCTINSKDPIKRLKKGNIQLDHAVLAVEEKGEKFLFDATNGDFITAPVDLDSTKIETTLISEYVIPNEKRYLIICPKINMLNFGREQQCEKISEARLCTMTISEVIKIREKIIRTLQNNMSDQFCFHLTHEGQRSKIESLYKELLPYSDDEIKSYIVRK